jgi:hypothetical protein
MSVYLIALILTYNTYCGDVSDDIRTKVSAAIQTLTPDERWRLEQGRVPGAQETLFRGSKPDLENYPPSRRAWLAENHANACQTYKTVIESKVAHESPK